VEHATAHYLNTIQQLKKKRSMARKKTTYKIMVHLSYRDRQNTYTEVSGLTKREANAYLKERCYTTPSRTYTIEKE